MSAIFFSWINLHLYFALLLSYNGANEIIKINNVNIKKLIAKKCLIFFNFKHIVCTYCYMLNTFKHY